MKAYEPVHVKDYQSMPKLKDESRAIKYRSEGKAFHQQGKLFEALESYNKSLCVAQLNSVDIPLAFGHRSVVYLEAKEYELCLENIQLARDYGYPSDKIATLSYVEEKCKKLMESHIANPEDDPWNFFKLSYPANEKIPFLVNCVELRKAETFGRYVITNQDLHPGDIICIEEPFFKFVHNEAQHMRCTNCLKSKKMSLIPSEINQTAMFCSKECKETATKTFLQAENDTKLHDIKQRMLFEALAVCDGSFDKLKQLMDDTEQSRKTIFDFDLSDDKDPMYRYNLLLAMNSLSMIPVVKKDIVRYMERHPVLDHLTSEKDQKIAKDYLLHAFSTLTVNSFGIEWVIPLKPKDTNKDSINTLLAGDGLCPFGSLMNHSCSPNIDRLVVDNKFVFYVRRPIKAGQQLFTCYGTLFIDALRDARQETLKEEYGFDCECEACVLDFPASFNYPWTGVAITVTEQSNVGEWKKLFKKNCRTIEKHQDEMSQLELCRLMLQNLYYLVAIGKTEPFIF